MRFIRDEKRRYPFMWLAIGGLFFASSVWAIYAEFVTRVPWQEHQKAFFEMELEQSKQALERAKGEWDQEIAPSLAAKLKRKADIEESMRAGAYKQAKDNYDRLSQNFADAETQKTFAKSDLDEAYYYRNLKEYERDAAAVEARRLIREASAATDPNVGAQKGDAIYADPPAPPRNGDESDAMYHLRTEIRRMQGHIEKIDGALGQAPSTEIRNALRKSRQTEQEVVDKLEAEVKHQKRLDTALAAMAAIDGPADPPLTEKDPKKRDEERKRERERVCAGKSDTRNCLLWLQIEPVDTEYKAIDIDVSKRRRTLADAELRQQKAEERAKPKFDPSNLINTLVGPYQIQQVVLNWIDYDREVDKEQVDRCQTCHMGVDSANYTSAAIDRTFRTHPYRGTLLATHPIDKFGCTACHQGQGRATDDLAHSTWKLTQKFGKERWHFEGDHYWEDPLLPIGELREVVVDDQNDELAVMVRKNKWDTIKLEHRSPEEHAKNADVANSYKEEADFLGAIQEKLAKLVDQNDELKKKWHAVVRKVDNRVQIGLERNNPSEHIPAKQIPGFGVKFPKAELASVLGYAADTELVGKEPIVTATAPPSVVVRSDGMAAIDKNGRFHPPRGDLGLQIPDDMRNRFIVALPEAESGCLKCHSSDVDLKQRASKAKYIAAKLDYEKAEAQRKADPEGYRKAHDNSDELPAVAPDPAETVDPVPTFSEGRALFKKLNCTGCHILDGFPADKNTGPSLDNVTAKVSPEWILTWLRNPRGWRAKTRMPNLWPKPLDPASKRPYAAGSPEYTKWLAQMKEETIDVAAFLVDRSDKPSTRAGAAKDAKPLRESITGYADVPGATADRGKLLFESYGCQACHVTSDDNVPEPWRSRERDIAPTLSNMGSKTTADWIAYWVENPARYWHGTKMPNLRLSHDEAASIAKYIVSLKSKPLDAASVDKDEVAMVADANKRNERVPCSNVGGQTMSRVECGERIVGYYGCFGCHQISGFEKAAPVAPELGGFAKKDVTTLDFGYAIADHHLQTTETFATLKLDSPRIYRRDRIELKMADFDLSPREIRSIVVFLKGLVNSKPKPQYSPVEQPEYQAALEGRQLVEDYNCRGCHMIEERGADIDHARQAQLAADPQARAPFLNGEGMRVQPEWLFNFLRDPGKNGIRPWLHPEWAYGRGVPDDKLALRMPTFNLSNEQVTAIVRYFASWDGQEYPYQVAKANDLTEQQKLYTLTHMLSTKAANCLSCHYQGDFPVERGRSELGKMAPNFNMVARRLRPEWVRAWLLKPQNWLPYTKMTAFWATTDRDKDAELWPAESDPFRSPAAAWNEVPGVPNVTTEQQVEMVRDFLFGLPPDAVFPKPGQEASSPLVKTAPAEQPRSEIEETPGPAGKDNKKKPGAPAPKPGAPKPGKKTGALPTPPRM